MGLEDLSFVQVGVSEVINDPLLLVSLLEQSILVTNHGTETLEGLGFYIMPAPDLGSVDNPADFPPETDYQDLLTWGSQTVAGLVGVGGIKVKFDLGLGEETHYFTRSAGSSLLNKIPFKSLAPGESYQFKMVLEAPPAVAARRLFVSIVLE